MTPPRWRLRAELASGTFGDGINGAAAAPSHKLVEPSSGNRRRAGIRLGHADRADRLGDIATTSAARSGWRSRQVRSWCRISTPGGLSSRSRSPASVRGWTTERMAGDDLLGEAMGLGQTPDCAIAFAVLFRRTSARLVTLPDSTEALNHPSLLQDLAGCPFGRSPAERIGTVAHLGKIEPHQSPRSEVITDDRFRHKAPSAASTQARRAWRQDRPVAKSHCRSPRHPDLR